MALFGFFGFVVLLSLAMDGIVFIRLFQKPAQLSDKTPFVSVLLPVRNEEKVLIRCLDSLIAQDYPLERMEILIGNDASTDQTAQIILSYASRHPRIKVIDIEQEQQGLKAKANVLAQLATKAKGSYFLFTDADMQLPSTWISAMLFGFENQQTGVVNGVTAVAGNWLQSLEWVKALSLVKVITDLGGSASSMGNNMAVSKMAYTAVGGYESIPFSLTEDYELYKNIIAKGFNPKQLYSSLVLGYTLPEKGFFALMNQRKRWLTGAFQLPIYMVFLLLIQMLFVPLCATGALFYPSYFLGLLGLGVFLRVLGLCKASHLLRIPIQVAQFLLFEMVSWTIPFFSLLYYYLPFKINWKNRSF